jgi:glycosyltransferase involved in cell wall biosynthesis
MQSLASSLCSISELDIRIYYFDMLADPMVTFGVPVERIAIRNFHFDDFDIIHTNGIRPDLFAWINRKKIKCHISTIHNFVFEDLEYTYSRFISLLFGNIWLKSWKRADKLVCVSKELKSYYLNWFASSKLEVVLNGIPEINEHTEPDQDFLEVIKRFRSEKLKIIGTAGVLTKRKGLEQVVALMTEVIDIALIIIGNGKELPALQKHAKELGVAGRCFFCGFRSNAVSYFKHFDLFIMPSRSEGFSLALVEAVQQKVPVVCSDISVFRELFSKEEVTFFKLDDFDSLSKALRMALEDGLKKTESAYSRYQNTYTDKLMASNYLKFYKSLLLISGEQSKHLVHY